tara:strand:+ start:6305 stop:6763 length:459 start_codon:yes stop_codon:yes gene_type:complete
MDEVLKRIDHVEATVDIVVQKIEHIEDRVDDMKKTQDTIVSHLSKIAESSKRTNLLLGEISQINRRDHEEKMARLAEGRRLAEEDRKYKSEKWQTISGAVKEVWIVVKPSLGLILSAVVAYAAYTNFNVPTTYEVQKVHPTHQVELLPESTP